MLELAQPTHADRNVDLAVFEASPVVGLEQGDLDVGVRVEQGGEGGRDEALEQGAGDGHAQPTLDALAHLRGEGVAVAQGVEDGLAVGQVTLAGLGQREPPGGAVEQAQTEGALELADVDADDAGGALEPTRGRGEAPLLEHERKNRHLMEALIHV